MFQQYYFTDKKNLEMYNTNSSERTKPSHCLYEHIVQYITY